MTRAELKVNIQSNLGDIGADYYSEADLNDSIQDTYDEVAVLTRCITKSTSVSIVANLVYYNFSTLISDYYSPVAIFNNSTNLWLGDSTNVVGFDNIRWDWENWRGEPQMWAPATSDLVALAPTKSVAQGTLTVWYYAQAPTLASDSDEFLLTDDLCACLEYGVTADLLEQSEEWTKAGAYWDQYMKKIIPIKEHYRSLAKADLLLRLGTNL